MPTLTQPSRDDIEHHITHWRHEQQRRDGEPREHATLAMDRWLDLLLESETD